MRLNPVLENLKPYHAGPSLDDIRRRYNLERVSRLSANESPWGPFPEVIEAMKGALDGLNRYPDGACDELRGLLAARLPVGEDRLTFGNGSCELLMLLGEAFLSPGRHVVLPHPSFVMYRAIALAQGASFSAVELPHLDYDLDALVGAVK
jgi:histidinol-phosphate aminotransferase